MKYKIACPSLSVEWHLPYYSAVPFVIFILTVWICLDLQYLLNCLDLTYSIYFSIWPFIAFFPPSFHLFSNLLDYVQLLLLIRTQTGRLSPVLLSILWYKLSSHHLLQPLFCLIFKQDTKLSQEPTIKPHISSEKIFWAVVWNSLNSTWKLHYIIHYQCPVSHCYSCLPFNQDQC